LRVLTNPKPLNSFKGNKTNSCTFLSWRQFMLESINALAGIKTDYCYELAIDTCDNCNRPACRTHLVDMEGEHGDLLLRVCTRCDAEKRGSKPKPEHEYTRLIVDGEYIKTCVDCGAYSWGYWHVRHNPVCIPGISRQWVEENNAWEEPEGIWDDD